MSIESIPSIATLSAVMKKRSGDMKRHQVFSLVRTINDLRIFMGWHVFAVWDFMSLVKRLQIEYTTMHLPWCPPKRSQAARLINEIVLGEESDNAPNGDHRSHFEIYLAAMEEIGASTHQIRQFVELVDSNMSIDHALRLVDAPCAIQTFVKSTVSLALEGRTSEVIGSFLYGREDVIPEMFKHLLRTWELDANDAPMFVYYLNRHIDLDGDSHGPAALQLMREEIGSDEVEMNRLLSSAVAAIEQRIRLWDELAGVLIAKNRDDADASALAV